MNKKIWAIAGAALLAAVGFTPAQAATTNSSLDFDFETVGLIVKYEPGVAALAPNGEPTGENAAGANLVAGKNLGQGWHSVDVAGNPDTETTWKIAQRLMADPRVAAVDLNRVLKPAAAPVALSFDNRVTAVARPATAARSLKAADAFIASEPTKARIKLSWAQPASLGSGKLSGYRISYSVDKGAWQTLTANTRTRATTFTIVSGLSAGSNYSFRVAAVTSQGSATRVGAFSAATSVVPTTAPSAPILTSGISINAKFPVIRWNEQTPEQQGGAPTTYLVTATADGVPSVGCETASTSCTLTGMNDGITYKVAVVAKNKRGSAQSAAEFKPADAYYSKQWWLWGAHGANVSTAWSITAGSPNVVVAVLDTGITKHPDLDANVVAGYDFVSSARAAGDGNGWDADASDPGDANSSQSSSWHGTHVAGIIAASSNSIGVIGIAPNVKIQPVRVLGSEGGSTADLIAGLRWAAGLSVPGVPTNPTPAKVINISMGTDSPTPCRLPGQTLGATEEALAAVKTAGVTTITAAGNFNMPAAYSYPGNCYPTLNVGATNFSGDRAVYSNYSVLDSSSGDYVGVDLSAPGGDRTDAVGTPDGTNGRILSTVNSGKTVPENPDYGYQEGTSMSSPVVAGVVALLYSVRPNLTFEQVWTVAVQPTLTPFAEGTQCATKKICGGGIINAAGALAAVLGMP